MELSNNNTKRDKSMKRKMGKKMNYGASVLKSSNFRSITASSAMNNVFVSSSAQIKKQKQTGKMKKEKGKTKTKQTNKSQSNPCIKVKRGGKRRAGAAAAALLFIDHTVVKSTEPPRNPSSLKDPIQRRRSSVPNS